MDTESSDHTGDNDNAEIPCPCESSVDRAIQHSLRRNARRCFTLLAGMGGLASITFDVYHYGQNKDVQFIPFTIFYAAFCIVYAIKVAMFADEVHCELQATARQHPEEFSKILAERFEEAKFSGDEDMKKALQEVLNACWKDRPPCDPPENS